MCVYVYIENPATNFLLFNFIFVIMLLVFNHNDCFVKKSVRKNFAKLTGKHLCQSFFSNKLKATPQLY